jgi:hypothetical protein
MRYVQGPAGQVPREQPQTYLNISGGEIPQRPRRRRPAWSGR